MNGFSDIIEVTKWSPLFYVEGTMENTTKDRILDEALIMFAENGYKGTNLRDLASQLGLSKGAYYQKCGTPLFDW